MICSCTAPSGCWWTGRAGCGGSLGLLLTHTVLAAVLLPLVLRTLYLAWRQRFETHRRWARWTWPIWMYVSVTGVLIYLLLYHVFPQR